MGKNPERYKLVEPGTIFYNPMRILLGSIAYLDEGEEPGITSPDYVVFRTNPGVLHPSWFYCWLRSDDGASFIRGLARGAVRERMLFRRLAAAEIPVPPLDAQALLAETILLNDWSARLHLNCQVSKPCLPRCYGKSSTGHYDRARGCICTVGGVGETEDRGGQV